MTVEYNYCCFLDTTKAFDGLKFDKLFLLLERNVASIYTEILLDMYTRQNMCVSWPGHKSNLFAAYNLEWLIYILIFSNIFD